MLWQCPEEAGQRVMGFDGLSDEHVIMEKFFLESADPFTWACCCSCKLHIPPEQPSFSLFSHQTPGVPQVGWSNRFFHLPPAFVPQVPCLPLVLGLIFVGKLAEFLDPALDGPSWGPA